MNSFLLEIGLEEVPASMVQPSIEQLRELVAKTLQQQNLSGQIEIFGKDFIGNRYLALSRMNFSSPYRFLGLHLFLQASKEQGRQEPFL